ncbi:hypothetical protein AHiyo6_29100 [Arthrobacter sp. Hiyo6]|nr:hypothetical protein AHiyo6_29100 [Arthrobacter sp. Hiyo6]
MNSGQIVGIIIGVVVVLAIIAAVVYLNRKRKVAADRNRAFEMREEAKAAELGAREHEAKAARAEADAKQAEVEAERLRREARDKQQEAANVRTSSQEQLRKADELDPDVITADQRGAEHERNVSDTEETPNAPVAEQREGAVPAHEEAVAEQREGAVPAHEETVAEQREGTAADTSVNRGGTSSRGNAGGTPEERPRNL